MVETIKSTSELDDVLPKMDRLSQNLEKISNILPDLSIKIANEISRDQGLVNKVGAMLQSNYYKSGLKIRTGKLYEATGTPTITFFGRFGSKWGLKINLGSGASDQYRGGSKVHTVANSINYGSVRTPGNSMLGHRSKRTIKKLVKGDRISKKAEKSLIYRSGTQELKVSNNQLETSQGKATVIPPNRFYYLDSRQQQELIETFINMYYKRISEIVGLGE